MDSGNLTSFYHSWIMIGGLNRFLTGGRLYRNLNSIYFEEFRAFCGISFHVRVLGMSVCIIWVAQGTWHPPLLLIVVYVRVILRNHLTPAHHESGENVFIIDIGIVILRQVLILVSIFLSKLSSAERPKKPCKKPISGLKSWNVSWLFRFGFN